MRQVINIISGFFFGLAPFGAAAIIGIAVYASFPNIIGILILVLLGVLSFWIGLKIFKRVSIIGPIEFMTAVHASPDLDNLEPTKDSRTKRRSPEEFVQILGNGENLFKGGCLSIYGDWFGKPYSNNHEIESAEFDNKVKLLTLNFKEGEKLEIYNPKHIFEASSFLKIAKAERIKFSWYNNKSEIANQYYLNYALNGKKIVHETNVDWYKPIFDVSLGAPALMIYG